MKHTTTATFSYGFENVNDKQTSRVHHPICCPPDPNQYPHTCRTQHLVF